jgi:hypothetical protein
MKIAEFLMMHAKADGLLEVAGFLAEMKFCAKHSESKSVRIQAAVEYTAFREVITPRQYEADLIEELDALVNEMVADMEGMS